MLPKFFESAPVIEGSCQSLPDIILCVERQFDGSVISVPRCLDSVIDPLSSLTFTDFSISECLKKGVSYKSLNISPDLRLGFDDEIDSFNSRLEEISEQLFNSKD